MKPIWEELHKLDPWVPMCSSWVRSMVSLLAIGWLCFRALQVFSKPVDLLISVLGLDVPPAPAVSLFSVYTDGLVLHWAPNLAAKANTLKHHVYINGVNIGTIPPGMSYVAVAKLLPAHNYTIRIVATNQTSFQSGSNSIRFRTKPLAACQFLDTLDSHSELDCIVGADGDGESEDGTGSRSSAPLPIILPYSLPEASSGGAAVNPPTENTQTRKHSGATQKRSSLPRPADITTTPEKPASDEKEGSGESVSKLTDQLEVLQHAHEEEEEKWQAELDEFQTQFRSLTKDRDEAKRQLKERDESAKNMRRTLKDVGNLNTEAQQKKVTQERILAQRQAELEKLRTDSARLHEDAADADGQRQTVLEEMVRESETVEAQLKELQEQVSDGQAMIRGLEDSIRERGIKIKMMDEEKKAGDLDSVLLRETEFWESRIQHLQSLFTSCIHKKRALEFQIGQVVIQNQSEQTGLRPRSNQYSSQGGQGLSRRRAATGMGGEVAKSGIFVPSFQSAHPSSCLHSANVAMSAGPINTSIATSANGPSYSDFLTISSPDSGRAAALVSPSAEGALLPSGLLGDESEFSRQLQQRGFSRRTTSVDVASTSPFLGSDRRVRDLPGLGARETLEKGSNGYPVSLLPRNGFGVVVQGAQMGLGDVLSSIPSGSAKLNSRDGGGVGGGVGGSGSGNGGGSSGLGRVDGDSVSASRPSESAAGLSLAGQTTAAGPGPGPGTDGTGGMLGVGPNSSRGRTGTRFANLFSMSKESSRAAHPSSPAPAANENVAGPAGLGGDEH